MQLLDFTPGHEAVIPAYESHGAYPPSRQLLPNPRVQPTGRGGPWLRAGTGLLVARLWKH